MANAQSASVVKDGMKALLNGGKAMKHMPKGKMGKAMVGFTALDLVGNLHAGDDLGTASVKAGANAILWSALPGPMAALTFAPALAGAAFKAGTFVHHKQQWWNMQHKNSGVVGGQYIDSQRAQTMRQAAVQAIQGSKLNARSALGGEARIFASNPYGR
jgi:hypothetical protein